MGAKVVRHSYTLPQTPTPRRKGRAFFRAGQPACPHREGVDSRCAVRTLTTLELSLRPDALRLPNNLLKNPIKKAGGARLVPPAFGVLTRPAGASEGESFGKASPYRAWAQFGSFP